MSSAAKLLPNNLLYEKDYIRQTTPCKSYMYTYTHTLRYKIKSLTILNKYTSQNKLRVAYRNIGIVSRGLLLAVSG